MIIVHGAKKQRSLCAAALYVMSRNATRNSNNSNVSKLLNRQWKTQQHRELGLYVNTPRDKRQTVKTVKTNRGHVRRSDAGSIRRCWLRCTCTVQHESQSPTSLSEWYLGHWSTRWTTSTKNSAVTYNLTSTALLHYCGTAGRPQEFFQGWVNYGVCRFRPPAGSINGAPMGIWGREANEGYENNA